MFAQICPRTILKQIEVRPVLHVLKPAWFWQFCCLNILQSSHLDWLEPNRGSRQQQLSHRRKLASVTFRSTECSNPEELWGCLAALQQKPKKYFKLLKSVSVVECDMLHHSNWKQLYFCKTPLGGYLVNCVGSTLSLKKPSSQSVRIGANSVYRLDFCVYLILSMRRNHQSTQLMWLR